MQLFFPAPILAIENEEDREFMSRVYLEYYNLMYKTAYSILRSHDSVQDIINNACIALIGKISDLMRMDRYKLPAYIVSTVRNTTINFIARRDRQQKHSFLDSQNLAHTVASDDEIEASIVYREQIEEMKQALSQLSERDREVLTLKYLKESSDNEIGLKIGIKPESVRMILMRGSFRVARKR